MTTTAQPTAGELLADLKSIIDQREQLASQDRELSAKKSDIERQLLGIHASTGLDALSGSGLSVRFDDSATRARYDPEKWESIAQWAVETKNLHVIQRRLSDAKIVDLVTNGIALPEGLTLETYTSIGVRRK